jgi:hypothetical protein
MNVLRFGPCITAADEAIGKFCARSIRVPAAAELVYLPFVMFKYSIETSGYAGRPKRTTGLFLVDLIQATPMNIPAGTVFSVEENTDSSLSSLIPASPAAGGKDEKAVRVGNQEITDTQILPALLDTEDAISNGKKPLRYDLMRLAGGFRYRNWEMVISSERAVVHYPFWLIYYRNRRGEMQLGVVDGLNGRREGGEIAVSIKKGLMEKTNEKKELNTRP